MTAKKLAWASRIDFRPDPADADKGAIDLGFLLEFTTEDYWVIAMIMLAAVDDTSLAGLDELSRKLIDNRREIIRSEVQRILPRANKPGELLPLLSAANPWSIHIDAPTTLDISTVRAASGASVEKIAEKYALSFFMRNHASETRKTRVRPAARGSTVKSPTRAVTPDNCPPPWILPPSCVIRPLHW